ncbi:10941_t:CDS:1, partial [Ambispora gerdemannii]
VAKFDKLDGQIKFTQVDNTHVQIEGQLNKGFTDTDPSNYHADIGGFIDFTFAQLGVVITPPGTAPFKANIPGDVTLLIGQTLTITHTDTPLDSAEIKSG